MRILFIGGTRFVGRAMVEQALADDHQISCLHRGVTDDPLFTEVEHLRADRDQDLSLLERREFDATIDVCAYVPRQVQQLHEALGDRGGHHVLVSSMSVFDETDEAGLTEDADLVKLADKSSEDVTGETYGGLKVECEKAATKAYPADRLSIVRPTYVIGPHDHTGRFTWWVRRIAHGGDVLAPGPRDAPMQVIDVRDLARFTLGLATNGTSGAFNVASPVPPFGFGDLLDAAVRAVGPHDTQLVWADGAWLAEQGETVQSLPLWTEGRHEQMLAADPSKALAAGLETRPITETVSDTWDWVKDTNPPMVDGWGVSDEREQALLAAWRSA